MSDSSERLVNVIRKMMDKTTENGCTQEEADSAATKVQELLSKHNIELSQIELTSNVKSDRGKQSHNRSAMYQFQRDLMRSIAGNNFCMYFTHTIDVFSNGKNRRAKRHVLLGRQVNILVSTLMYDYLTDTFDNLLPYQGVEKRGRNALLWLEGCAAAVVVRLDQKRRDMSYDSVVTPSGGGLVLSDVYSTEQDLNTDFVRGFDPGTTYRNRASAHAAETERSERIAAKERDLMEDGYSREDAWHVARGYAVPSQNILPPMDDEPKKTDAELRREKERSDRFEAKYEKASQRRFDKHMEKVSSFAYRQGENVGTNISLNDQVGQDAKARLR